MKVYLAIATSIEYPASLFIINKTSPVNTIEVRPIATRKVPRDIFFGIKSSRKIESM